MNSHLVVFLAVLEIFCSVFDAQVNDDFPSERWRIWDRLVGDKEFIKVVHQY